MAITINGGTGVITGVSVGGLPTGSVTADTLATNSVDSAELIDGAVDDSHMAAMAASKLTGALPAISGASLTGISGGKVLQVVSHNCTSQSVCNSTSFVSTNSTMAITPSATSSKIWIIFNSGINYFDTNTNLIYMATIYRGSTDLGNGSAGFSGDYIHSGSYNDRGFQFGINYLDSPSSTSSVTYTIYHKTNVTATAVLQWYGKSGLTLIEIGA